MGYFPDTIAAYLAGAKVQAEWLVHFDFTSEPMFLRLGGKGPLRTLNGQIWQGLGDLGSISGIEQAVNGQAPQATFTLSGIDADITRLALDSFTAEVKGRLGKVFIQYFGVDDPDDPDNQRVLDNPYAVWGGRFLQPSFRHEEDGSRSVTISAESLFSLRSRPQYATYTDSDQRARFPADPENPDDPGDRGFEFVPSLVSKVVTWPDY